MVEVLGLLQVVKKIPNWNLNSRGFLIHLSDFRFLNYGVCLNHVDYQFICQTFFFCWNVIIFWVPTRFLLDLSDFLFFVRHQNILIPTGIPLVCQTFCFCCWNIRIFWIPTWFLRHSSHFLFFCFVDLELMMWDF